MEFMLNSLKKEFDTDVKIIEKMATKINDEDFESSDFETEEILELFQIAEKYLDRFSMTITAIDKGKKING